MAVFFHLAFKVTAIVIYLFGNLFGQEFLGMFVALVFLISIDFWVVKNVTGRLLVGLRWWNYIDDEGQSHWVFENRAANPAGGNNESAGGGNDMEFVLFSQQDNQDQAKAANRDSTVFWAALFFSPLLWFFFLISAIFSFNIHWVVSGYIILKDVVTNSHFAISISAFRWYGSGYEYVQLVRLLSMPLWRQI